MLVNLIKRFAIASLLLHVGSSAMAKDGGYKKNPLGFRAPRDCELQLLSFGFDERFIFRNNHDGANLSTMANWNPRYGMGSGWVVGASLGVSAMKAVEKDAFLATRYQLALSYWGLNCVYYPEVFYGLENWGAEGGGSFRVYGLNNYIRLTPIITDIGWLDFVFDSMESWVFGYTFGDTDRRATHMYTLGMRFILGS